MLHPKSWLLGFRIFLQVLCVRSVLGFPSSIPAWPSVSLGLWPVLPFGSGSFLGCSCSRRPFHQIRVQCTAVESTSSSNSKNSLKMGAKGWLGYRPSLANCRCRHGLKKQKNIYIYIYIQYIYIYVSIPSVAILAQVILSLLVYKRWRGLVRVAHKLSPFCLKPVQQAILDAMECL